MELEAEVTKQDFKRFNTIALKRITERRKFKVKQTTFNILYWVPLGIAAGALYTFYDHCHDCEFQQLNIAVAFFCIWIVAGIFLQKWYFTAFVDNAVSESGTVLGKIKYLLDENGISEVGKDYESTFAWSSIHTVESDGGCLYLFTDYVKAIILPVSHLTDVQKHELSEMLGNHLDYAMKQG